MTQSQPPEATWSVVLENINLVYKLAHQHCRSPQDFNDLVQEGLIGLFEGARRFDPQHSSGASFGTYVYHYIRQRILGFFQDRVQDAETDQIDEEQHDVLSYDEQDYVRNTLRNDLLEHMTALTDDEQLIILLRWLASKPLTGRAIAEQIGMSHQRVQQIESKALGKLRESMLRKRKERR
jgi:RNA polymerase sigma factor (sigma-70 family)